MDQYREEMANNFTKFKEENKVIKYVHTPSILKLIGDLRGKSIIDYGCGSGFHTRIFKKAGAKQIIGIDYSKHMIDLAKQIDSVAGIDGIEYHVANCAEDLNLGQHDVVFSSFFLVHATDRNLLEKFVSSMFNSAKSGAICWYANLNPKNLT
jgi:2-polyprenyl-3-methyl-5-hydroxy-6-metoxy-1,4-benzoquinol methylase